MMTSTDSEPRLSTGRALVRTELGAPRQLASDDAEHRHAIIAVAAYFLAEQRHFVPGHEVEDWLAAEIALEDLH